MVYTYCEEGSTVSKVEEIGKKIQQLSPSELAEFCHWFAEFDAELWDRQIETDAKEGKLDRFGKAALDAHNAGLSVEL